MVRIMEMDALPGHPAEPVLPAQGRDRECCADPAGSPPAVPAAPFAARVALNSFGGIHPYTSWGRTPLSTSP